MESHGGWGRPTISTESIDSASSWEDDGISPGDSLSQQPSQELSQDSQDSPPSPDPLDDLIAPGDSISRESLRQLSAASGTQSTPSARPVSSDSLDDAISPHDSISQRNDNQSSWPERVTDTGPTVLLTGTNPSAPATSPAPAAKSSTSRKTPDGMQQAVAQAPWAASATTSSSSDTGKPVDSWAAKARVATSAAPSTPAIDSWGAKATPVSNAPTKTVDAWAKKASDVTPSVPNTPPTDSWGARATAVDPLGARTLPSSSAAQPTVPVTVPVSAAPKPNDPWAAKAKAVPSAAAPKPTDPWAAKAVPVSAPKPTDPWGIRAVPAQATASSAAPKPTDPWGVRATHVSTTQNNLVNDSWGARAVTVTTAGRADPWASGAVPVTNENLFTNRMQSTVTTTASVTQPRMSHAVSTGVIFSNDPGLTKDSPSVSANNNQSQQHPSATNTGATTTSPLTAPMDSSGVGNSVSQGGSSTQAASSARPVDPWRGTSNPTSQSNRISLGQPGIASVPRYTAGISIPGAEPTVPSGNTGKLVDTWAQKARDATSTAPSTRPVDSWAARATPAAPNSVAHNPTKPVDSWALKAKDATPSAPVTGPIIDSWGARAQPVQSSAGSQISIPGAEAMPPPPASHSQQATNRRIPHGQNTVGQAQSKTNRWDNTNSTNTKKSDPWAKVDPKSADPASRKVPLGANLNGPTAPKVTYATGVAPTSTSGSQKPATSTSIPLVGSTAPSIANLPHSASDGKRTDPWAQGAVAGSTRISLAPARTPANQTPASSSAAKPAQLNKSKDDDPQSAVQESGRPISNIGDSIHQPRATSAVSNSWQRRNSAGSDESAAPWDDAPEPNVQRVASQEAAPDSGKKPQASSSWNRRNSAGSDESAAPWDDVADSQKGVTEDPWSKQKASNTTSQTTPPKKSQPSLFNSSMATNKSNTGATAPTATNTWSRRGSTGSDESAAPWDDAPAAGASAGAPKKQDPWAAGKSQESDRHISLTPPAPSSAKPGPSTQQSLFNSSMAASKSKVAPTAPKPTTVASNSKPTGGAGVNTWARRGSTGSDESAAPWDDPPEPSAQQGTSQRDARDPLNRPQEPAKTIPTQKTQPSLFNSSMKSTPTTGTVTGSSSQTIKKPGGSVSRSNSSWNRRDSSGSDESVAPWDDRPKKHSKPGPIQKPDKDPWAQGKPLDSNRNIPLAQNAPSSVKPSQPSLFNSSMAASKSSSSVPSQKAPSGATSKVPGPNVSNTWSRKRRDSGDSIAPWDQEASTSTTAPSALPG